MDRNYEQEYKKAFEAAKGLHDAGNALTKKQMEIVFPQLSESEDERIRKVLINIVKSACSKYGVKYRGDEISEEKLLAYLEKQKEQKEPHFTKRNALFDECVKNCDPEVMKNVSEKVDAMLEKEQKPLEYLPKEKVYAIMTKLTELSASNLIPINSPEYLKIHQITKDVRSLLDYPVEQKAAEWAELQSEFKNINEAFEDGKKEVVAHPEKYGLCQPAEWSEKDMGFLYEVMTMVQSRGGWIRSDDAIENVKSWLKSLPERFNLQPKQEWSEDDEKMLVGIIERGSAQIPPHEPALRGEQMEWLMNRLKSLRNRPKPSDNWKPSEEQMKALLKVVDKARELHYSSNSGYDEYDVLRLLYKQLKEL